MTLGLIFKFFKQISEIFLDIRKKMPKEARALQTANAELIEAHLTDLKDLIEKTEQLIAEEDLTAARLLLREAKVTARFAVEQADGLGDMLRGKDDDPDNG